MYKLQIIYKITHFPLRDEIDQPNNTVESPQTDHFDYRLLTNKAASDINLQAYTGSVLL